MLAFNLDLNNFKQWHLKLVTWLATAFQLDISNQKHCFTDHHFNAWIKVFILIPGSQGHIEWKFEKNCDLGIKNFIQVLYPLKIDILL